jgi:hypothetical protein
MPYVSAPVPPAPITDRLLETLIGLLERDPNAEITEAEGALILQATPGCLRELLTYRRLLGQRYDGLWLDGAVAASNIVRLSEARDRFPDPRGTA